MPRLSLDRRTVLPGAGAMTVLGWASAPGRARAEPVFNATSPFDAETVRGMAEKLSTRPFSKPSIDLPDSFKKLSYDQHRDIRFRSDEAIWRNAKLGFELQLLPMGWLFETPVEVWLVDGAEAKRVKADENLFKLGPLVSDVGKGAPYGLSGFRIHGPINRPDYFDEYVVFQGASYFRAVGRDQNYGLSARGLAINTARPEGEEFPIFRSFWIEKPQPGAHAIVVYALLDSDSTTGAYKFTIEGGETTVIDVDATLYPRRDLKHVGLAPLTSMFLHGPGHHRIDNDFRPAVHDSNGLAIQNGNGECIWRPLTNPQQLQTSAFIDNSPKGFGLCQRGRAFHDYEDLEARYERRPSLWIEPRGAWGKGFVELVEIPTDEEIHDNIAAFWKPHNAPEKGKAFPFAYRMHWGDQIPVAWSGARAIATRVGAGRKKGRTHFVVDFIGPAVAGKDLPIATVTAYPGTIADVVVQPNPEIDGVRVSFELDPANADLCELRLILKSGDEPVSETWLYRWTRAGAK